MRIRELMEASGVRCIDIAHTLGVAPPSVTRWVNGQGYPTADKLPALAKLLGCSIDDLYDGQKEQSPPA